MLSLHTRTWSAISHVLELYTVYTVYTMWPNPVPISWTWHCSREQRQRVQARPAALMQTTMLAHRLCLTQGRRPPPAMHSPASCAQAGGPDCAARQADGHSSGLGLRGQAQPCSPAPPHKVAHHCMAGHLVPLGALGCRAAGGQQGDAVAVQIPHSVLRHPDWGWAADVDAPRAGACDGAGCDVAAWACGSSQADGGLHVAAGAVTGLRIPSMLARWGALGCGHDEAIQADACKEAVVQARLVPEVTACWS